MGWILFVDVCAYPGHMVKWVLIWSDPLLFVGILAAAEGLHLDLSV